MAITCQKLLKLVDPRRSYSLLHQYHFFRQSSSAAAAAERLLNVCHFRWSSCGLASTLPSVALCRRNVLINRQWPVKGSVTTVYPNGRFAE